jgi:hypothetical protein
LLTKSKHVEKKSERNEVASVIPRQVNYWEGAPTRSYIFQMSEPTFNLLDLEFDYFEYRNLEHYQYYLTKKDDPL